MALAGSLISLGVLIGIYALLSLGLNIKFGFNGLLDIGHVAFYLVGAYGAALLVLPPDTAPTQAFATYILGLSWTWPPAIAVGVLAAGVFGMLVALPAIRLREDYLAIAVLGISVIAKRTIQTESWLANGPTSLKGWTAPLEGLFPMPGGGASFDVVLFGIGVLDVTLFSVPAEVVFGLLTFGIWAILVYGLAAASSGFEEFGALDAVVAAATLGVGYVAARRARRDDGSVDGRIAAAGGAVFGVLAVAMAYTGGALAVAMPGVLVGSSGVVTLGMYRLGVYLLFGFASLSSWALGGVLVANHYDAQPRADVLKGVGLGLVFVVVFLPLILLGGGDDRLATVGLLLTLALVVALVVGLYRLAENWSTYGDGGSFVATIGIGALTLFGLRYFALALVQPFKTDGLSAVVSDLIQNLLWLVNFSAGQPGFNYRRFFFLLVVFMVALVYLLMELTVKSPFGRVLKAIREDEDVATALGKNTFRYKVQSMILGSAVAGLAGTLAAIYFGALTHQTFAPRVTFIALLMVVIGGTANNKGAILGAVIFWGFRRATTDLQSFFPTEAAARISALRLAFIGALFMIILYYRPEGIWGEERVRMEDER